MAGRCACTGGNFTSIDPIKALYWSAVNNGVAAAPAIASMMLLAMRPTIMAGFTRWRLLQLLGWLAMAVMVVTVIAWGRRWPIPRR